MDFLQRFIPYDMKLRLFLLQLTQLRQQHSRLTVRRKLDLIGQNRLQKRHAPFPLPSKSLSRIRPGQTGNGTDLSRLHFPGQLIFFSGIDTDLVDLFFPCLFCLSARQHGFYLQASSRDFHPGQPVSLRVSGDLIDSCAERIRPDAHRKPPRQPVQQLRNAFQLQGGAKITGKQASFFNQLPDRFFLHPPCFQKVLQRLLRIDCTCGDFLIKSGILSGRKIHAAFAQPLLQFRQKGGLITARLIHLIDKKKGGNPISLQQIPERPGMPLNPVRTADDQHSRIQHLQGAFHLRRKIHMSRRVHKSNRQVFPAKSRLFGKNGDSPFPFQLIIIQKGVPVVHPPRFPDAPAQIEERFRQGGFSCVNVGDHADAALSGRPLILIIFSVFSRIFHENTSFLSKQRNPQRIRFPTLRRPLLFILPRMGGCVKSFSKSDVL